jgi:hypothetical protein
MILDSTKYFARWQFSKLKIGDKFLIERSDGLHLYQKTREIQVINTKFNAVRLNRNKKDKWEFFEETDVVLV